MSLLTDLSVILSDV